MGSAPRHIIVFSKPKLSRFFLKFYHSFGLEVSRKRKEVQMFLNVKLK